MRCTTSSRVVCWLLAELHSEEVCNKYSTMVGICSVGSICGFAVLWLAGKLNIPCGRYVIRHWIAIYVNTHLLCVGWTSLPATINWEIFKGYTVRWVIRRTVTDWRAYLPRCCDLSRRRLLLPEDRNGCKYWEERGTWAHFNTAVLTRVDQEILLKELSYYFYLLLRVSLYH